MGFHIGRILPNRILRFKKPGRGRAEDELGGLRQKLLNGRVKVAVIVRGDDHVIVVVRQLIHPRADELNRI